MASAHSQNKGAVTFWVASELLEKLNAQAAAQKIPRTVLIENILRQKLGLDPITPHESTPKKYLHEKKSA